MGQDHHGSGPSASAQAAIQAARAQLLAGRGPGASPQEITAHTRDRPRLGGHPTPQQRAQRTAHTAVARGDPDPLTRQVTTTGNQIAASPHHTNDPTRAVGALPLALAAATLGAALGIAATATMHHRRHRDH